MRYLKGSNFVSAVALGVSLGCNSTGNPVGERLAVSSALPPSNPSGPLEAGVVGPDTQSSSPAVPDSLGSPDSSVASGSVDSSNDGSEPTSPDSLNDAAPTKPSDETCPRTKCARDVPLAERDTDGDGILDVYDADDDNDGISDRQECDFSGSVGLVNGGFELPFVATGYKEIAAVEVPGWQPLQANAKVELWTDKHMKVRAPSGRQFIELNVQAPTDLYQDFRTIPGMKLSWAFSHRGRNGSDEVRLSLGTQAEMETQGTFITNTNWKTYAGEYEVPAKQRYTRLVLEAITDGAEANLVDQVVVEPVCEQDSDDDGCVDSEDPDVCLQ